jgi:hypothetical protein
VGGIAGGLVRGIEAAFPGCCSLGLPGAPPASDPDVLPRRVAGFLWDEVRLRLCFALDLIALAAWLVGGDP